MAALRHLALSCCLLCALAGVVRIFWPENGSKAVINTVLMLYIVASVVPMAAGTDWSALAREMRSWARSGQSAAQADSWDAYAEAIARQASAEALRGTLAAQGITATVDIENGRCTVTLPPGSDATKAAAVLQSACGDMPYTIAEEGAAR